MNLAEALLEFRRTQSPNVLKVVEDISIDSLNIISISILAWLELEQKRIDWISQGKRIKLKSMTLNYQFPWCVELKELLEKENLLSDYFEIYDKEMRFKSCISEDQRNEKRGVAGQLFRCRKYADCHDLRDFSRQTDVRRRKKWKKIKIPGIRPFTSST